MINKIGVENFRVFKNYTEFEIRPITLLTGPNNAGKSSFTKLLLLLKNGFKKLDFETGNHNLESFEKILNWEKNDEVLKLTIPSGIEVLGIDFFFEIEYVKGFPIKISLANKNNALFDLTPIEIDFTDEDFYPESCFKLNFNVNYLTDLIYKKELDLSNNLITVEELFEDDDQFKIQLEELQKKNRQQNSKKGYQSIENLEKNYLLYDVKVDGKSIAKDFSNKILEFQNDIFSDCNFQNEFYSDIIDGLEKGLLSSLNDKVKDRLKNIFIKEYENQNIAIEETPLGNFIFSDQLFKNPFDRSGNIWFGNTLLGQFQNFSKILNREFNDVGYLPVNRGSQRRILANKSENIIDEVVVEYCKKNHASDTEFFLKKILRILEIEGDVEVMRAENSISIIYIVRGDNKINLADLGFGYSQIIPIILKIINHSYGTLIIEEPEANLHPNLQSKLADVFVAAVKFNPRSRFIIETHSEYFIRKLQYLTANQKISSDKSVIYYFNADKYVSANEPKVKQIEINQIGNLTDAFGPGFFDEATRLQFDLLKLNQPQNN